MITDEIMFFPEYYYAAVFIYNCPISWKRCIVSNKFRHINEIPIEGKVQRLELIWGDGLERVHLGVDFASGPTRTSVEDDEDLTKLEHRERQIEYRVGQELIVKILCISVLEFNH
jgi:hypothetical protein